MKCPHCQKELVIKDYEHVSISTCNDCEGVWLTPAQLSQITEIREKTFSPDEIQTTLKEAHPGISDSEAKEQLPCPACASLMNKVNYDYSSGVIIDVCPLGDGMWFSKDELEKVQIFMEHWNDTENAQKTELLGMLNKDRQEETAFENQGKTKLQLTMQRLMDPIFNLFEKMTGN